MNNEIGPISKHCRRCGESDVTDFSTCRYCSAPYDDPYGKLAGGKPSSINGGISPIVIVIGVVSVAAPFAAIYLNSQGLGFLGTTSSYRYGYHRGSAATAVPAGLIVFASQKILASAQDTIDKETVVLATDTRNYNALVSRADAYWTQLKTHQALADYTAAIAVRPMLPDTYEKRAIIHDAMSNLELAQKDRDFAQRLRR